MGQTHEDAARTSSPIAPRIAPRDISDAYLYLLGRLLVLRQEHRDFRNEGFRWNVFVHRKPGGVMWANPNLDVAYSEAWVALDENSCTVIEVPRFVGRYYTVQILDMWGETLVNLNERTHPSHPSGAFALCTPNAKCVLPAGAVRVDLPSKKARVLARIELGDSPEQALELQSRLTMAATGAPQIATPIEIPMFTNDRLPSVEVFDSAAAILAAEPDSNPGTEAMQAKVRTVSSAASHPPERNRIDTIIRQQAWATLEHARMAMGTYGHGWVHPKVTGKYGDDWLARTVSNLVGIWSNTMSEVVYFGGGTASSLNGSDTYSLTFGKDDQPKTHARYFWSITCVDGVDYRVVPNPLNRYVLNQQSRLVLGNDGTLTLYFAPKPPPNAPEANWLPTPPNKNYMLTFRVYGPDPDVVSGKWFPPPLRKR